MSLIFQRTPIRIFTAPVAGGEVSGPSSGVVTPGNPAVWDGPTGRLLKEVTFAAFKASLVLTAGDIAGLGYFGTGTDAAQLTGVLDPARITANTLPVDKITFSATARILGRNTAGAGAGEELTGAQVLAITGALPASSYTAADVLAKLLTVDGAGSGLDADLLDGNSSAFFLPAASYTAADVLAKLITVDGSGSLLDADFLDGQSGSFYNDAGNLTGTINDARHATNSIALTKLVNASATAHFLMRTTAGAGAWEDGTAAQAKTALAITTSDVSGLGTAAAKNTGTSGNTVPLLDGANTWSAAQTFSANATFGADILGTAAAFSIKGASSSGASTRIHNQTADASDNGTLLLAAGGAPDSATRGAYLTMYGNEHASAGVFVLQAGSTAVNSYILGGAAAGAQLHINNNTSDGSDSGLTEIGGGGSIAISRGAYCQFYGNEHATQAGHLILSAGAAATHGQVKIGVGKFVAAATTTTYASLNLPTGSAPSSPVDGDIWREDNTNTGLKVRINGVTKTVTVA